MSFIVCDRLAGKSGNSTAFKLSISGKLYGLLYTGPPVVNSKSKFKISMPLNLTIFLFSLITSPIATASTSHASHRSRTVCTSSGLTVNIILS